MSNIEEQYLIILQDILDNGVEKTDRTGVGTKSIFGRQIRHKMSEGFPLLTTKKMAWKAIVTELLWFLRGDTNIEYLVDNGCNVWNGDAFKNYYNNSHEFKGNWPDTIEEFVQKIKSDSEFAYKWGELGPIYGAQWRSWGKKYGTSQDQYHTYKGVDQIANLINELKTNPDSRRLMVNAWNVDELHNMILPPCHYGFQMYTRELSSEERVEYFKKHPESWPDNESSKVPKRAISLIWNQRSVDTFLGLPFNIASYALLLEIIAKEVNMVPDELIGNLGDTHLYLNHIEQAKEQLTRKPFDLPKLKFNPIFLANLEHKGLDEAINGQVNFEIENYQSHPAIKASLNN